ncbi:MAG: glycine cleavage T C-terminal barrel domain-containing protein [Acidimicrobiales bacterium]
MTAAPSATVHRTTRDLVVVEGDDAATYLQGQLSQDVAGLPVGASAASFVLSPQGKVAGWGRVHRVAPDRFEVDVDAGAGEAWGQRLSRFLLRTKATVTVEAAVATLEVRGATVAGGLAPIAPHVVGTDLIGWGGPGLPEGLPADAVEVGDDAAAAARIRAGIPAWGAELDEDTIPATVGQWAIDGSVSFTKGCYTGQELVARIDSRGGNVPRHLAGLVVDGPVPAPGSVVEVDGEVVAAVTSAAADPATGGAVALAFLPRGVDLSPGGVPATVGLAPDGAATTPALVLPTPF